MNNTTTIRTLMATIVGVVVVVLNLTATSLVAEATTTSSTPPQPQNVICTTHPGNNATCSQERIISYITPVPLPTAPPQPSAILTIIKHVINDIVGTISAKDFTSSASGTNVSPQSSFPGAQSPGTTVTLKPSTFSVALLQQANATTIAAVVADHNNCSSGDIITCTHKETHHSAKDTTPFVLPIPFP
jgi:hypothetical protein